jgi:hypothetical protein
MMDKWDEMGEKHGGKIIFAVSFVILTIEGWVEWLL